MKKKLAMSALALIVSATTFAGGLLTNTNQNVPFLRMLARGASIDIDGVYSNPAGLVFLPQDGFYLSLNGQSAYQTRVIDASFNRIVGYQQLPNGQVAPKLENYSRQYKGKASAPIIPSFQAAYKKGDWTLSASFAIGGGGGKASFDDGLPMFDSKVMAGLATTKHPQLGYITPDKYTITSAMDGTQYIFGAQLGLSYKVNKWLGVFAGGRMNYVSGGYEGFLYANLNKEFGGARAYTVELECDQTGWGLTPILGVDVKLGKWNFATKYEFMTNLNIENETKKNSDEDGALKDYKHGVNTPNDIPALLTVAAGYEVLPTLRASVEYHYFFDKEAGMAGNKQDALTHGTIEWLAGVEYDVTKQLTISGGYQNTNYGLSNKYQVDTSFSCDSYSVGLGAAVKLTDKLKLNVAYFWTTYSDYTKVSEKYNGLPLSGTDVYSRTNKVFGLGLDFKF